MSINLDAKPEMNVVNVGDELIQDQIDAITTIPSLTYPADSPSGTNPFVSQSAVEQNFASIDGVTKNTTTAAFTITQTGTGNSFVVNDSAFPDMTYLCHRQ